MLKKTQDQAVTENSVAFQAGGDINISGLTYSEVRDIAFDVFRNNYPKLTNDAMEIVDKRVEEFTFKFIEKVISQYPEGLLKFQCPDFQYELFSAQKEYARIGDNVLGDLLTNLLIERCKNAPRSFLEIILREAIETSNKLCEEHLATLSIIFLFSYPQNHIGTDLDSLGSFLDKFVLPLYQRILVNESDFDHLEYFGCGTLSPNNSDLVTLILTEFQGLFFDGFSSQDALERGISIEWYPSLIIPCINNPNRFQIKAINRTHLEKLFKDLGLSDEEKGGFLPLYKRNRMKNTEIKEKCITLRPYMENVFNIWERTRIKNFSLSKVGVTIAHANIRRFVNDFTDLSTWIK